MSQSASASEIPASRYHSVVNEYSNDWYNAHESCAYFNLARDNNDNLMPHCLMLSITPGVVSDLFKVEQPSDVMVTIVIFKADKDLENFLKNHGECVVSAISSSGTELIET